MKKLFYFLLCPLLLARCEEKNPNPGTSSEFYEMARSAASRNKADSALFYLDISLARNDSNEDALWLKYYLGGQHKKYAQQLDAARKLIQIHPDEYIYSLHEGMALYRAGDTVGADRAFSEALNKWHNHLKVNSPSYYQVQLDKAKLLILNDRNTEADIILNDLRDHAENPYSEFAAAMAGMNKHDLLNESVTVPLFDNEFD